MSEEVKKMDDKNLLSGWLASPIWAGIGGVFAVFAVLATFYIFYVQRENRSMEAVILSNTSLVEVAEGFGGDVEILYHGKSISNSLSLLQVKLENTGNQNIEVRDYNQPINFEFSPQTEIITATLIDSNPKNINPVFTIEKNVLSIEPLLLNSGNRFIIQLLTTNIPIDDNVLPFGVDARMVGIDHIPVVNVLEEGKTKTNFALVFLGMAIGGVSVSIGSFVGFLYGKKRTTREVEELVRLTGDMRRKMWLDFVSSMIGEEERKELEKFARSTPEQTE